MDGRTASPLPTAYSRHDYHCSFVPHPGLVYPGGMTRQPASSPGPSLSSVPAETPPHLVFLEDVYGYTEPPTVGELAAMAMLPARSSILQSGATPAEQARDLAELAAQVWDAAALERRKMKLRMDATLREYASRSLLHGPLKVGVHFMPRIDWEREEPVIPFRRYLELVVGLTREEDRMLWWRAYVTAKIRRLQHRDRWGGTATVENLAHPEWCGPDAFPIPGMLVADAISLQQREGFQKGFPACHDAEGFRLWRLEMKTPDQRADQPLPVDESAKKALEGK